MSIPLTGSKSIDDRRRRRLVVSADDSATDVAVMEDGVCAAGVESELVISSAAAPWVPFYESRIWAFGGIIGLLLVGMAFALTRPMAFRAELAPLTQHLLQHPRPVLGVLIQTLFWFLSAELALLIGWYRAQCKLDYRGLYRIWPWAAAAFATAALCSATNAHQLFGHVIAGTGLLSWRPRVVAWLLPVSVAALPFVLLLDRDVRRRRSTLYTLRVAWLFGLVSVLLELFAVDLAGQSWLEPARTIVPMFGTAVLFLGLWLHARVVAYVCPDPPEASEVSAATQVKTLWAWIIRFLPFRRTRASDLEDQAAAKSKRSRKKTSGDDEDEASAPKRKRRAPARRTAKPRSRAKVVEETEEEEQVEEDQAEDSYSDESHGTSSRYDESASESDSSDNEWEEEDEEEVPPPPPKRSNTSQQAPVQARKPSPPSWQSNDDSSDSSDDDEDGDEAALRRDSGMTSEQMKGLSKRQKRDLRRQLREQQRNQRR